MDMREGPCNGCTRRWVKDGRTCHSVCPDYLGAIERHQKLKETIRKNSQADHEWYQSQNDSRLHNWSLREKTARQKRGRSSRI